MSPLSYYFFYLFIFHFTLARFIAVVSVCLVCDSSIVATCPAIPALLFVLFVLFLLFVGVFLVNQSRTKGESWSTANKFKPPPPVILVLAAPRWCFGSLVVLDVVCGYVLLFLLDIKIENRQK